MGYIDKIKKYFEENEESYTIEITKYPGHATELVKSYCSQKEYRVYAVGGDGTLNEVLNGIIDTSSTLGVIPCGSGNDFIKSIVAEITDDIFIRTLKGSERSIDLGKINDRYFLNISSVGFDSEVVYYTNKIKKIKFISGPTAYILGILRTLFTYRFINAQIDIDGIKYNKELLLTAISNGKCYGGGIKITPKANIEDGVFDLCIVDKVSRLKIFFLFPKAIKGEHESIKQVNFYRGKKVSIKSHKEFVLNIDGELIKTKEVICELIPKAIKILIP